MIWAPDNTSCQTSPDRWKEYPLLSFPSEANSLQVLDMVFWGIEFHLHSLFNDIVCYSLVGQHRCPNDGTSGYLKGDYSVQITALWIGGVLNLSIIRQKFWDVLILIARLLFFRMDMLGSETWSLSSVLCLRMRRIFNIIEWWHTGTTQQIRSRLLDFACWTSSSLFLAWSPSSNEVKTRMAPQQNSSCCLRAVPFDWWHHQPMIVQHQVVTWTAARVGVCYS